MVQAHADAMGTLGSTRGQRRAWEGDGRIDLRSVANCNRQLPYHVAWQRGFRQAAGILNPTVAIDNALETVRELDQGTQEQCRWNEGHCDAAPALHGAVLARGRGFSGVDVLCSHCRVSLLMLVSL